MFKSIFDTITGKKKRELEAQKLREQQEQKRKDQENMDIARRAAYNRAYAPTSRFTDDVPTIHAPAIHNMALASSYSSGFAPAPSRIVGDTEDVCKRRDYASADTTSYSSPSYESSSSSDSYSSSDYSSSSDSGSWSSD